MPVYAYQCNRCEHAWEEIRCIVDRHAPEEQECPECTYKGYVRQTITSPNIVSGVNLSQKVPGGFKDVLKKIKKAHPFGSVSGELVP